MLGDNPMQSEFACHAGLEAKFFCRMCWVKGKDGHQESLSAMVGGQRQPAETQKLSEDVLFKISTMQRQSDTTELHTNSGIKDRFLQFFLDKVAKMKKLSPFCDDEELIREAFKTVPLIPFSPIWHLKGLNPHAHTPVEILHVILLGIVKYFWRDAVDRLKEKELEILIIRLNSLDVSGIDPLVSALAVFVLYDLLPPNIIKAWAALGALVPLVQLEAAIDHFMKCTMEWTSCWFNKSKNHFLKHLQEHIWQFGPAVLFATFNAVIRQTVQLA
ncbi:hypothetical protein EVJ58_g8605 [Rhodofomes roseus]|uniref:Uncharacterized protein n=1 Tax=Rhodofomes roseus TaxID=34475 RepID=A0A4Y9XXP7_9APHY|nr:hypothetical protein EVJ58_g8605 [Rhodofomes roseus]